MDEEIVGGIKEEGIPVYSVGGEMHDFVEEVIDPDIEEDGRPLS